MNAQESLLNQEVGNSDLSKVAALQQKRTLAFINHFTVNTVQFLNEFSKKCETKLMDFQRKIEKVEAAMVLLETRLSSIPEIANTSQEKPSTKPEDTVDKSNANISQDIPEHSPPTNTEEIKEESNEVPVNLEYERFIKMVQVGVPLEAAKLKASLEGLDPNILQQLVNKK